MAAVHASTIQQSYYYQLFIVMLISVVPETKRRYTCTLSTLFFFFRCVINNNRYDTFHLFNLFNSKAEIIIYAMRRGLKTRGQKNVFQRIMWLSVIWYVGKTESRKYVSRTRVNGVCVLKRLQGKQRPINKSDASSAEELTLKSQKYTFNMLPDSQIPQNYLFYNA